MHGDLLPADRRQTLYRVGTDLVLATDRLDADEFREGNPTYPKELHESERAVLSPLLEEGFELAGRGLARCVLRFPAGSEFRNYVVKLPRFGLGPASFGPVQNKREVLVWARHGATGEWPLVPVVDHEPERFAWLVMPYGDPIDEMPEEERERLLHRVHSHVRFLPAFDMRELFEANLVRIDGTPLLADYGLPDGL